MANTGGGGVTTDSVLDAAGTRLGTKSGSTVTWLVPDLHGSIGAGLSTAGTSVTDALRYDGYGVTLAVVATGGSGATAHWKHQGRLDLVPGTPDPAVPSLYDFGFREYAPSLGAFTSIDDLVGSAQDPASLNRFLYAAANPATLIDPDGHVACSAMGADAADCHALSNGTGNSGGSTAVQEQRRAGAAAAPVASAPANSSPIVSQPAPATGPTDPLDPTPSPTWARPGCDDASDPLCPGVHTNGRDTRYDVAVNGTITWVKSFTSARVRVAQSPVSSFDAWTVVWVAYSTGVESADPNGVAIDLSQGDASISTPWGPLLVEKGSRRTTVPLQTATAFRQSATDGDFLVTTEVSEYTNVGLTLDPLPAQEGVLGIQSSTTIERAGAPLIRVTTATEVHVVGNLNERGWGLVLSPAAYPVLRSLLSSGYGTRPAPHLAPAR